MVRGSSRRGLLWTNGAREYATTWSHIWVMSHMNHARVKLWALLGLDGDIKPINEGDCNALSLTSEVD